MKSKQEKDLNLLRKLRNLQKILKVIPIICAVFQFLFIILLFFGIDISEASVFLGSSLISLSFFYLASFAFRFCYYHRLPIYYTFITLILCLCDTYIGLPINLFWLFVIHIVLFLIMVIQLIKFYI